MLKHLVLKMLQAFCVQDVTTMFPCTFNLGEVLPNSSSNNTPPFWDVDIAHHSGLSFIMYEGRLTIGEAEEWSDQVDNDDHVPLAGRVQDGNDDNTCNGQQFTHFTCIYTYISL